MHANTKLLACSRQVMIERRGQGVPVNTLLKDYRISRATFYKWWRSYLSHGTEGLLNRSSRPQKIGYRLNAEEKKQIIALRSETRFGPARLAHKLGIPQSTIYRYLKQEGLNKLIKGSKEPVIRYEAKGPGELVHLDVLYLFALKGKKVSYQFTVVDDYTRMAYASINMRRTTDVAIKVMKQAQTAFGFSIKRVLTDNDPTFTWTPKRGWPAPKGPHRFTLSMEADGIRHKLTRLGRPQTNGKVERFHRTIQDELYRAHPLFQSEEERANKLTDYLNYYNSHRNHTALAGLTPAQRRDKFFDAKLYTTS